ncbi:HAD-IB family hydrolase [Burkholderia humptydooensis]|uniref:HAD-IB family hydrolase n=2 Tax=Burkholderia humptydooensis TaxID=430531 RepID=A0A7U4P534_9BURK|nr:MULTISPECIES: HAD family hydrolase [Burkholderia]AJY41578.1 HAD phosphoserine phosphatase-like hydrolase, IB family protein [Burkholderia sp. 2002721687]ALX43132.1 phosphoserine phosphatase [Burkholderia humptydooensis]EIP84775.1 HAD-superfamily hydrolase subfamily IB, PSPase-like protein [Burkholderia humptydooensis MSMB43]QPS44957.1 HAD-IB family hydrolase [Burkholderia humptydooensis]
MHKNVAMFDLDHTLLPLDTDQAWGRFIAEFGWVDNGAYTGQIDEYYRHFVAEKSDIYAYLAISLAPFTRYPRTQLQRWHARFMDEVIRPAIRPRARALVDWHRENGDLCGILTATNVFVARPIAAEFGIDHLLGLELETKDGTPDGEFTGRSTGLPCFREGKIVRMAMWLDSLGYAPSDFERIYFYGDSINDVPLLDFVTHPVATNPDSQLSHIAGMRGWPVMSLY